MYSQTLPPTENQVTVKIPDEYINHQVEIVVVLVEPEATQRLKKIGEFCDKHQADASLLKYTRDELYD